MPCDELVVVVVRVVRGPLDQQQLLVRQERVEGDEGLLLQVLDLARTVSACPRALLSVIEIPGRFPRRCRPSIAS